MYSRRNSVNKLIPGLFNRAILLSGSALSSWAVVEDPVSYALKLAKASNCTIPEDLAKDNELIVDCLRDASLEELLQIEIQAPTFLSAFGPSVDGVVIKADFQKDLLSYLGPEFQGFGWELDLSFSFCSEGGNNKKIAQSFLINNRNHRILSKLSSAESPSPFFFFFFKLETSVPLF